MARVEISVAVAHSSPLTPSVGLSVQVNYRSGAAATVYAAATGATMLDNPLTTDAAGRIEGWLEEGSYDLVVSGTGFDTYTQPFEAVSGHTLGVFNVKSYGAKGDGTTDDTTAIHAARDAAGVGGVVVFPQGTYKANALTPLAGQTWRGTGATISLIDPGTADGVSVHVNDVDDVTIRDLTITSNAASRTGVYGLIRGTSAARLSVLNCRLLVSSATSIHLIGCTDSLIQGNYCSGAYADGIHLQRACKRVRVIDNHITAVNDDAIGVISYYDAGATNPNEDILVQGNVIQNILTGSGVSVLGGRRITVSDNQISDIDYPGIQASGSWETADYYYLVGCDITGNSVYNVGLNVGVTEYGIKLADGVRRVNVVGNSVDKTRAGSGIYVARVAKDVVIADNNVSRAADRGIFIDQTTSTNARVISELFTDQGETGVTTARTASVAITGNNVRKSTLEGIFVNGDTSPDQILDVTVTDNVVAANTTKGIVFDCVRRSSIVGNITNANVTTGIALNNSLELTVSGNTAAANTDGIVLVNVDDSTLTANVVVNNTTGGGIYEDASCTGNLIAGNVLKGNNAFQINVQAATVRFGNIGGDEDRMPAAKFGAFNVAPAARAAAYTPTNVSADRSYDANATTIDELADVLGTLIADLQTYGLLQ